MRRFFTSSLCCIPQDDVDLPATAVTQIPTDQPESVIDYGSSRPQSVIDSGGSLPQSVLHSSGYRPPSVLDSGDSRPQSFMDSGGSRIQSGLASGSSRPESVFDSGSSRPESVLDSGGSRPESVIDSSGSRPQADIETNRPVVSQGPLDTQENLSGNLSCLPVELVQYISKYVNFDDTVSLRNTCKRLRTAITNTMKVVYGGKSGLRASHFTQFKQHAGRVEDLIVLSTQNLTAIPKMEHLRRLHLVVSPFRPNTPGTSESLKRSRDWTHHQKLCKFLSSCPASHVICSEESQGRHIFGNDWQEILTKWPPSTRVERMSFMMTAKELSYSGRWPGLIPNSVTQVDFLAHPNRYLTYMDLMDAAWIVALYGSEKLSVVNFHQGDTGQTDDGYSWMEQVPDGFREIPRVDDESIRNSGTSQVHCKPLRLVQGVGLVEYPGTNLPGALIVPDFSRWQSQARWQSLGPGEKLYRWKLASDQTVMDKYREAEGHDPEECCLQYFEDRMSGFEARVDSV